MWTIYDSSGHQCRKGPTCLQDQLTCTVDPDRCQAEGFNHKTGCAGSNTGAIVGGCGGRRCGRSSGTRHFGLLPTAASSLSPEFKAHGRSAHQSLGSGMACYRASAYHPLKVGSSGDDGTQQMDSMAVKCLRQASTHGAAGKRLVMD